MRFFHTTSAECQYHYA